MKWPCRISLGNFPRSTSRTRKPLRASSIAVGAPAQRAPTTITSYVPMWNPVGSGLQGRPFTTDVRRFDGAAIAAHYLGVLLLHDPLASLLAAGTRPNQMQPPKRLSPQAGSGLFPLLARNLAPTQQRQARSATIGPIAAGRCGRERHMAAAQDGAPRRIVNFGGNQVWQARCYQPRDEQEVLDILQRHRGGRIRALGALHSWSDVAVSPDVVLDMSRLDRVEPVTRNGETFVQVGAGCRLQDLLNRLHAATDRTLPTLGAIKRQTVSGAISTGTHGSGKPSLPHFVASVRVAAYDAGGKPVIMRHDAGDGLLAARCALGCMGVILSVEMPTVAKYLVEETIRWHRSLTDLLARYSERPLTQFILVPYVWAWLAWERRPVAMRERTFGERLKAWLIRASGTVNVDVCFHLMLKAALLFGDDTARTLMRLVPRLMLPNVTRIDHAEQVLTLHHNLFRHEEMELFVPESRLADAVEVLRAAVGVFAGETAPIPEPVAEMLRSKNLLDDLMRHRGTYVQHYPLFFRRLLPEDTLISMGAGAPEPRYSISVFTYLAPDKRQAYNAFCAWLARCMNVLFAARP